MQLIDGTLVVCATDLVGFLECDHLVTLELARARGEVEKPFRDDPQLELIRQRGYEHERRYIEPSSSSRPHGRRDDARRPADAGGAARRPRPRRVAAMQAGRRRDLPGDVLRRALARSPGLPDPSRRPAVGPRRVQLRRRRHEARQAGQGRRDHPDVRLRGPARTGPGHPARDDRGRDGRPRSRMSTTSPTTPPTTAPRRPASRRGSTPAAPRRRDLSGARRPLPRLLVVDRCASTGAAPTTTCRSSPNITRSQPARARRRGRRHARGARRPRRPTGGRQASAADPGPAPSPGRRSSSATAATTSAPLRADPARPTTCPASGLAALPRAVAARRVLRHRGRPVGARRRARVPVRLGRERSTASPSTTRSGRTTGPRRRQMFEAFVDLVLERLAARPGDARLPLRRLRVGRAQAADAAPRDARGRGRPCCSAAGRPRQPLRPRRAAGRSGHRSSSYSIKKIEKFYMPEREGGITDAGFSVVEYERWMETERPGDPRRDRRLQPRRLRLDLRAPRLARGRAGSRPPRVVSRTASFRGRSRDDGEPTAGSWRPRRPRREPARTRCAMACPRTAPSATTEQQGRWLLAGAPRLAPARGEAAVVGPLPADGGADRRPRRRRLGARRAASSSRTSARSRSPRSTATGSTRRRRRSSHEGKTYLRSTRRRRPRWDTATIVALDPLHGHDRPEAQLRSTRIRVALIPIEAVRDGADARCARPARGSRHRARARPGPARTARPATWSCAARRGCDAPARGRAARPTRRDAARRRPPARRRARRQRARDPGPARHGQDLHRRADGARRSSSRASGSASRPSRTASSPTSSRPSRAAADGRAAVRPDRPARRRRDDASAPRRASSGSRRTTKPCARASAAAVLGRRRRHELAVGARGHGRRGRRPVRRRGRPAVARHRLLRGRCRRARSSCSATRNQLPQVSQGTHPGGRRGVGARAPRSARRRRSPRIAACSSGRRTGSTRRSTPSSRTRSTRAGWRPDAANAAQDLEAGAAGGRHRRPLRRRCRTPAAGTARPRRRSGSSPRSRRFAGGRGPTGRATAPVARGRPTSSSSRPTTRRSPRSPGLAQQRLGVDANVGTVDKFQGREAPVAIYSMTTSSPEDAPRDLEFLYSGNRLNVAMSRARGLAVLVAIPELLHVACRTPEQMRLVNAFCRYSRSPPSRNGTTIGPWSSRRSRRPRRVSCSHWVSESGRARHRPVGTGWPRRNIPPMSIALSPSRLAHLRQRTIWTLVAGVALGSTGHIAAVTVGTIVAGELAGTPRSPALPGRVRRARGGDRLGAAVDPHGPPRPARRARRSATPSASSARSSRRSRWLPGLCRCCSSARC